VVALARNSPCFPAVEGWGEARKNLYRTPDSGSIWLSSWMSDWVITVSSRRQAILLSASAPSYGLLDICLTRLTKPASLTALPCRVGCVGGFSALLCPKWS